MYTDQVQTICRLPVACVPQKVEFQTLVPHFFQPLETPDVSETIAWTSGAVYCRREPQAAAEPGSPAPP